eukprot:COSAG05_NODE_279_length_12322_cov_79.874744_7_plen_121_part_00
MSGKVTRIAELDEVMGEIEAELALQTADGRILDTTEPLVHFANVDIVTPRGQTMAAGLTLSVTPETPLMVTGASASGKSSLVRVLGGLWPLCNNSGELTRPAAVDGLGELRGIFCVPSSD